MKQYVASDVEFAQLLHAWAHVLCFDFFAYLTLPAPWQSGSSGSHCRFVTSYPKEWANRYERENLQLCDPIVALGRHKREAFAWSASDADLCLTSEQRRVMAAASVFQINCGITAPVHGPNGELSLLTLASRNPGYPLVETVEELGPALQWLAICAHNRTDGETLGGPADSELDLTFRERECLFWTAQGKTSWEISKIIDRSEATVNFHLRNAISKLGASNKCHAVTKAIKHGFLAP